MNCVNAFSLLGKNYISANFAGKSPKNVFFVFTYADCISSDENFSNLKKDVRTKLADVFRRKDGSFDEKLFNSRVFYVDAFHLGQIRIEGEAYDINRKGIKISRPDITLEETEIHRFERELKRFLDSDEKYIAQLRTIVSHSAGAYQRAKNESELQYQKSLLPVGELKENTVAAKRELDNARTNLNNISRAFDSFEAILYTRLCDNMSRFKDEVDRDWPAFASSPDAPSFNAGEMLKIAAGNIGVALAGKKKKDAAVEKLQAHFDSLSSFVNRFLPNI